MVGRWSAAVVVASTVVGVARPVDATGAHGPAAARVQIARLAHEGPRGTILADLRAACRPGFVATELTVTFDQGEFTFTGLENVGAIVCDGRWHHVDVSGPEGFDTGEAVLTARLTVTKVATGATRVAADRETVWVRPAAAVRSAHTLRIADDGTVRVRLLARCDAPWLATQISVQVTQGDVTGSAFRTDDGFVTCDDGWHRVTLTVAPSAGQFHRGPARADASIDLLDPEFFDPVTQATSTTHVRLVR